MVEVEQRHVKAAQDLAGVIRTVQPNIVKIHGAGGYRGLEAYQSGFLFSSEGHILTVWSYVLDSDGVTVYLDDGRKLTAEVVGMDPRTEIAVLKIDLTQVGGSALTDAAIPVPEHRDLRGLKAGTPLTYVPFRNGILLALAAAWAEARGVTDLVCGFNIIDSPNYPDTRREFVKAMEKAINAGTKAAFGAPPMRILAPFLELKKSAIIQKGLALGVDYSYSVSCYSGGEVPCGVCSSCLLREKAWREAGQQDPLLARLRKEGKP
jgi:7-cyano-7-deazaguanine synthase